MSYAFTGQPRGKMNHRGLGAAAGLSVMTADYNPVAHNADKLGPLFVNAIQHVMSTQDVYQNLTPVAFQQALMVKTSVESIAGTTIIDILNTISPTIINGFIDQIKALAFDISNEVFGPSTDLSWVSSEIEQAVPLIGAMISVIQKGFTPAYQAAGYPCHSGDPQYRQAGCQALYTPVSGSAPYKQIIPCDLFVEFNGGPMPDIGQVLIDCFEPIYQCEDINNPYLCQAMKSLPSPIPPQTSNTIAALRAAIQASASLPWMSVRPSQTDGGALLWPIYLDLINYQYRSGRINDAFIRARLNATSWWCKEMNANDGDTSCFAWEKRGYQGMINLLDGWQLAIASPYSQYKNLPNTEVQMIAAAQKALGKGTTKIIPTNIASAIQLKQKTKPKPIVFSPAAIKVAKAMAPVSKTHPVAAAAVGAGAAAALIWFFL